MLKKVLAIVLLAFMLTTLIAGCGSSSSTTSSKSSVSIVVGGEPQYLDPALNSAVDGGDYILHVFEGLTRVDKTGKTIPGIAKSWDTSKDGLTYTFHLRDAKWSDGKPVTAGDFEYAWKRALNPDTAAIYAYQLYYLKNGEAYNSKKANAADVGVKATDDKTLVVTLDKPTPYFIDLMHFPTYMPIRKDIIDKYGDKWTEAPESYIGDGAFKMTAWKHKDEIVMAKNDNYWDKDSVKLSEIHWKLLEDDTAALNAYQSGELDVVNSLIPPQETKNLIDSGQAKVYDMVGTYYIYFNTKVKPLDDVRVRQALTLAIDRTYICDQVTQAGQKPAVAVVPYKVPGVDPKKDFRSEPGGGDFIPPTPDIQKAKQLLADAGYPDGKGFPEMELAYNTQSGHKAIMEAVQNDWQKNLGITVKPPNMDWKVLQTKVQNKDYQLARMGWIGDYNDPMTFLDMWTTTSGNNNTNWSNKDFDNLIEQAKSTGDQKKRMDYMHQAEKIFLTDMPACPIYFYVTVMLQNPKITDMDVDTLGFVYLQYAYFK